MHPHRYYRVFLLDGFITRYGPLYRGQYFRLSSIEMRASSGGPNLCSGGTPIASSSEPGFPASNAFDGSSSTDWMASLDYAALMFNTSYIGYDFGAPVIVTELKITATSTDWTGYSPKLLSFQYSDDGTTWLAQGNIIPTQTLWTAGETRTFDVTEVAGQGLSSEVFENDENTILLIHSDNTNGDDTFVDSGGGPNCPHTFTVSDYVEHSTDQAKFGGSSIKAVFDPAWGTPLMYPLSSAENNLFASNFTVDAWVYCSSAMLPINIIEIQDDNWENAFYAEVRYYPGQITIFPNTYDVNIMVSVRADNDSSVRILDDFCRLQVTLDQWHHFEICRMNDAIIVYVDGRVAMFPAYVSGALNPAVQYKNGILWVGNNLPNATYVDEYRLSNITRHVGDFAVPAGIYESGETPIDGTISPLSTSIYAESTFGTHIKTQEQLITGPQIFVTYEPPHGSIGFVDISDAFDFSVGANLLIADSKDDFSLSAALGSSGNLSLRDEPDIFAREADGEVFIVDNHDTIVLSGTAAGVATCAWGDSLDTLEIDAMSGALAEFDPVDAVDLLSITGQPETTGGVNLADAVDAVSIQAMGGLTASGPTLLDAPDRVSMTAAPEETGVIYLFEQPDIFRMVGGKPSRFSTHIIQYQKARY